MTVHPQRHSLTRRRLLASALNLAWIAPLAYSLAQMVRYLSFNPPGAEASRILLGSPAAFVSFPVYVEKGRIWLMRDGGGYYALDAVCTHLGCIIKRDETQPGFKCDCHGSRFGPDGSVRNGPATQPLRYLRLTRGDDGAITVDRSQQVDAAFRLPPA